MAVARGISRPARGNENENVVLVVVVVVAAVVAVVAAVVAVLFPPQNCLFLRVLDKTDVTMLIRAEK